MRTWYSVSRLLGLPAWPVEPEPGFRGAWFADYAVNRRLDQWVLPSDLILKGGEKVGAFHPSCVPTCSHPATATHLTRCGDGLRPQMLTSSQKKKAEEMAAIEEEVSALAAVLAHCCGLSGPRHKQSCRSPRPSPPHGPSVGSAFSPRFAPASQTPSLAHSRVRSVSPWHALRATATSTCRLHAPVKVPDCIHH